jgi:transposase
MDGLDTEHSENRILQRETEETDSLLTASEVADLLQVHISTVRKWINLGILESCHQGPRGEKLFQKNGEKLFQKKDVIESMLIFKPYSIPIGLM